MENLSESTITDRIRLVRKQYAGQRGKSKLARALGISITTYDYYENDKFPPVEFLRKVCEITGTDSQWLLTGEKSPEIAQVGSKRFADGPNAEFLSKLDAILTEKPNLVGPVEAFVELLCEKDALEAESRDESHSSTAARPGWIPVLGRTAAGMIHFWSQEVIPQPKRAVTELDQLVKKYIGKKIIKSEDGKVSIDLQAKVLMDGLKKTRADLIQVGTTRADEIVEFIDCEELYKLFPDSFALRVDGDSMSPRINDGDIIISSPSVPAAQGAVALALIKNQIGVTCKLIRTADQSVHLIPINKSYETKVVDKKNLLWALAVLCHVSL